jgi:recombinational DNA repair protein RecT
MALKTIIKKACKQHFSDIYQNIETIDNDNYDLDNPLDIELKYKQEIEAITTIEDLAEYAMSNTGKGKDFDKMISIRKKQLDENS